MVDKGPTKKLADAQTAAPRSKEDFRQTWPFRKWSRAHARKNFMFTYALEAKDGGRASNHDGGAGGSTFSSSSMWNHLGKCYTNVKNVMIKLGLSKMVLGRMDAGFMFTMRPATAAGSIRRP